MKITSLLFMFVFLYGCSTNLWKTHSYENISEQPSAKSHAQLAMLYLQQGKYTTALDEIRIAEKSDSQSSEIFNIKAIIYTYLQDDRKAEENFKKSLRLWKNNSNVKVYYSGFLCNKQQYKKAYTFLDEAEKDAYYPEPEKVFYNRGMCLLAEKKPKNAIDVFEKMRSINPAGAEIYHGAVAQAYLADNQPSLAYHHLKEHEKKHPLNTAEELKFAAEVCEKVGNTIQKQYYEMQLFRLD